MVKKMLKAAGLFFIAFGILGLAFAGDSINYQIKATIESQNGLNVSIHNVDANTDVWDPQAVSSIDFGTLTYDATNGIFLPDHYCAVDVGVLSNAANWTVTHTVTSLSNGADNLDHNVIVTFVKTVKNSDGSTSDYPLSKVSYANSNGYSYDKTALSGGWLRIYYGIATGDSKANEPSDVSPITVDKPAGNYVGSITITLTP